ncbi:uncharacterized protein METZ01_LOCUS174478 [marine metagenome]|uniref:Uncharacterized protein n=1 Tax=marine metagenome TaxID=408172 RepID=A0A382C6W7_9ZZZZ
MRRSLATAADDAHTVYPITHGQPR